MPSINEREMPGKQLSGNEVLVQVENIMRHRLLETVPSL